MEYKHIPVLLNEVIAGLNIKAEGIYVDGTIGRGGHSVEILKKLLSGHLLGFDKDEVAIKYCEELFKEFNKKITLVHDDFKNLKKHLDKNAIKKVDGILLDLGVSSPQIDDPSRGFSYMHDAKLDMRMNTASEFSAYDLVNSYPESALREVFQKYGEEKYSKKIAEAIVNKRKNAPIETTLELVDIVANCYPGKVRYKFGHPAKRVFQAIRIEVNHELAGLYDFIIEASRILNVGGRMAIITFHSLEDRIVKQAFQYLEKDCICDKNSPICTCDKVREIEIINKKPIIPSEEELKGNGRAESAKLRLAEKLNG